MRLSTKGRIAVTALIDIALREKLGPVRLTDIALRQQISVSYLEQLFSKMRMHGLVTSTRGPRGGYELSRRTENISVTDIIVAVDDATQELARVGAAPEQDTTKYLWDTMCKKILNFTQTVTLKSLVLDHQAMTDKRHQKSLSSRRKVNISVQPNTHPVLSNPVSPLGQAIQ